MRLSPLLASILLLTAPLAAQGPARFKVALDAGHGGDDPGAKGRKGLLEKDATLALAKDLQAVLKELGLDVVMVREDDTAVVLQERAKVANAAAADLFLSLHFNANKGRSGRGSEVYFLSLDQGDEDARAVAEAENASAPISEPSGSVVSAILDDLAQRAFLVESERLAVAIQAELNRLGRIRQRGVKQAPFAVLRRAAMPAVLVEAAFISNPAEEARLKDPAHRKRLAQALARGIRTFLAHGAVPRRKAIRD